MLCERGALVVGERAFPIRNGRFTDQFLSSYTFFLQSLFSINVPTDHSPPLFACCIILSSMQLDTKDWTVAQVVLTAVGVGILSALVLCAATVYVLPDAEEPWE